MQKIEKFISLSALVTKWSMFNVDLKRLIRFAEEGLLEVRVLCPEIWVRAFSNGGGPFDIPGVGTYEEIIDGSWKYHVVDKSVLLDLKGRGIKFIKAHTYIHLDDQVKPISDMAFEDMVVQIDQVKLFEETYLVLPVEDIVVADISNTEVLESEIPKIDIFENEVAEILPLEKPSVSSLREGTIKRNKAIHKVAKRILDSGIHRDLWSNGQVNKSALSRYILNNLTIFPELKNFGITKKTLTTGLKNFIYSDSDE